MRAADVGAGLNALPFIHASIQRYNARLSVSSVDWADHAAQICPSQGHLYIFSDFGRQAV
ncbi:hypothetical protein GCM10022278_00560 [Allohahella marinimesophila]|uniref:Uncharacterized protein n=1 Tax=Allohahella marinimesophila TaxID=1054972 RepID=A0ABP7NF06_9GAMM